MTTTVALVEEAGPEYLFTMAEAAVCLRVQGIDDDNGGVGGRRRDREISNNKRGVNGGSRRDNAPE